MILVILQILLSSQIWASNHLNSFSTDGCSRAPDGYVIWNRDKVLKCCVLHDVWYWLGGTEDQRLQADTELYQCVLKVTGSDNLAALYYWGPRWFGGPDSNQSFRWGYGWQKNRYYSAVSPQAESVRSEYLNWIQGLSNKEVRELVSSSIYLH